MPNYAYVYIMSSSFRKLYIGITTHLHARVAQHKAEIKPNSHTAKYHINQLVYYERFTSPGAAINREKQLKGWLRLRKLELIITTNPHWQDLSAEWQKEVLPITP